MTTTILATRGDRSDVLALLGASAAVLILARVVGTLHRAVAPAVVVAAGLVLAVGEGTDLIGTGPLGGPFGYENATGAFFAQVAFAGAMVALGTRRMPLVIGGALAAIASGLVAAQASTAAAVSFSLVLVAVPALVRSRWARPAVLVTGSLFVIVLATTVVLGASYREGEDPGGLEGAFRTVLTERRVALWHDALAILGEQPGGVGPGRFDEVPPRLRLVQDADARWAHNGFLQQGAELGWAGLILTVLLFVWGFVRLWARPEPDGVVVVGAAALAALAIHASVDYVLHFPAVPLAAAALVGAAQAAPHRRFGDERNRSRAQSIEGCAPPLGVAGSSASG